MNLEQIVNCLPFVGMVTSTTHQTPIYTRLIEAGIIAVVTGYMAATITVAEIKKDIEWGQRLNEQRLGYIEEEVKSVKQRVSQLENIK